INTVLEWKFSPALRNGTPVKAITQIDVEFTMPVWYKNRPKDETPPISLGQPGVIAPVIISRIEPKYPEEARASKTQGSVIVGATVHKDGSVVVDNIVQGLEPGFTVSAIEAIEQWKFRPGTKNGEPVDVSLKIEVNFNLK